MSVPTHRPGCTTQMWETRCPDCGDAVFFFSCNCGSRVYFDSPGRPWPLHQDRCYHYLIRVMRDIEHVPLNAIRSIIEEFSVRRGVPIPGDVQVALDTFDPQIPKRSYVVEVRASGDGCFVEGKILTVTPVNLLKRFGYADSPIGKGLLGKLGKSEHVEIVIRQDEDPATRESSQFVFLMRKAAFESARVRQGMRTFAALSTYTLPDGRKVWIGDEARSLERKP